MKTILLILIAVFILTPSVGANIDCDDVGTPNDMMDMDCGGLDANITAYTGLVGLDSGTPSEVDTSAEFESMVTGRAIGTDIQASVTEGSLADSVIVSADIKDGEVAAGDLASSLNLSNKALILPPLPTLTLLVSELNDTSDPHTVTVAELKNFFLSNSESTGADEWDLPAQAEGFDSRFVKEANYDVTIDPNGTERIWFTNSTAAPSQLPPGMEIVNETSGVSIVEIISTENNIICKGDASWVEKCPDRSCSGLLVCQNYEGTGYDNSESWSETGGGGTEDEDDTTATVMRGSQQLKLAYGGGSNAGATITFTQNGEIWFHTFFKISDATPASDSMFLIIEDSVDANLLEAYVETGGTVKVDCGTTASTTSTMSDATAYHIFGHYKKGTGSDAECSIEFSADRWATGSGNAYASLSNGTTTADADHIELIATVSGVDHYYDQTVVDDGEISAVCE